MARYKKGTRADIIRMDAEHGEVAVPARAEAEANMNEPVGPDTLVQVCNAEGEMVWKKLIPATAKFSSASATRNHWSKVTATQSNKYGSDFPPLSGAKFVNLVSSAGSTKSMNIICTPSSSSGTEKSRMSMNCTMYTPSSSSKSLGTTINAPNSNNGFITPQSLNGCATESSSVVSASVDDTSAGSEDDWDTYTGIDGVQPKTEAQLLKEKADAACIGWPWTGVPDKLVTLVCIPDYPRSSELTLEQSPYHINQQPENLPLKKACVVQTSKFITRLFKVDDIAFEILRLVFRHHNSAWKLAATCQQMFKLVGDKVVCDYDTESICKIVLTLR